MFPAVIIQKGEDVTVKNQCLFRALLTRFVRQAVSLHFQLRTSTSQAHVCVCVCPSRRAAIKCGFMIRKKAKIISLKICDNLL